MTKKRQGKGTRSRPRRTARGKGPSSTGSTSGKTQTSSATKGEGGRTFSIRTAKNPTTLVSEAKRVAQENDATFRGDANSGSFSGKGVKGRYNIEGGTVKVTVTDKPALASWSTVESKVKEFFR